MITFISLAEIYHGAYKSHWGEKRLEFLKQYLKRFDILSFTNSICLTWAEIQSEADHDGHPISASDCWIAACARYYQIPLATYNMRHYQYVQGLRLITPNLN
jgi:tRNA(fMet)-specific endonuclease VapC